MRGGARIGGCVVLVLGLAGSGVATPSSGAAPGSYACHGHGATLVGTTGDDVLTGTEGPDVIQGRAGADTIDGLGGDDVICGSADADAVDAGAGDDEVWGDGGADRVVGGPGADFVRGGAGDDVLDGHAGADRLNGGGGADQCWHGEYLTLCESELAPVPIPLNSYNLADLGVTDLDSDGWLDVFSLNHNALDSVLRSTGDGRYADLGGALGLAQEPRYPGLEDRATLPRLKRAGLHVLTVAKRIRLHLVGAPGSAPATGSLDLFGTARLRARDQSQATYEKTETVRPNGLVATRISFQVQPGGWLVIEPYYLGGPVSAAITSPSRASAINVGAQAVHPPGTTFSFELRDRHGAAWTRGEGTGLQEAALVGGGLRGDMALFDGVRRDELLVDDGSGRYADVAAARTFVKDSCSARQTSWVDVDHDGLLDLYVACEFQQGNRLHHQAADGTFTEVGRSWGLDLDSAGPYRWVDLDRDGTSELVTAADDGVRVSTDQGGRFATATVSAPVAGPHALSASDVDVDGDVDLLLAATEGSLLLRNDNGALTALPATTLGLPDRMLTVAFVDQDNDGLVDVDASPGGLFRQAAGGGFAAADVVPPDEDAAFDALTTWFDSDGDGDRDRLHGYLPTPPVIQGLWVGGLLENRASGHHWLEVDLVGPPGNRSAIGALVTIGGALSQVGTTSESSRFSQGHYRQYAGLGAATSVDVTVRWPDGTQTQVADVPADQLLRIAQ